MPAATLSIGSTIALPKPELDGILSDLRTNGFRTVGPCLQDESIVYKEFSGLEDLPRGIASDQGPGFYRIIRTGKDRYFDFIPGGQSWKQFLFPPFHKLFSTNRDGNWQLQENSEPVPRFALIGARACEIAAIAVQDKIFLRPDFYDPIYRERREALFIIAVNCLQPNNTCFCTSLGTGPRATAGFDLCITELNDVFLVEIGSELGRSLLSSRLFSLPSAFMQNAGAEAIAHAAASITRTLDTHGLPGLLAGNLEADLWTQVGKRCLSCANCTMVCPTCFCWDVIDNTDLPNRQTHRIRNWDSCFNPNYSYVFGGNTRPSIRSRYRQWLTHKLGTWVDQFGVLGCVGCGRCITWCPAGIDLTEEIASLRREAKE
jgi:sulfhydrogenase subunit beta (sulfur reductase)